MLEIEERGVGSAARELEGAEEDPDADTDAVGEQEGLAQVPRRVRRARLPLMHAAPPPAPFGGLLIPAVALVELLDGLAQPLLRLPQAPRRRLGDLRLRWRRGGRGRRRRRARAECGLRAGGEVERGRREEGHGAVDRGSGGCVPLAWLLGLVSLIPLLRVLLSDRKSVV